MKSIIIAIGLGGLCVHHAYAQEQADTTLNRTVVVENQYNPEVMDAFKINVLPEVCPKWKNRLYLNNILIMPLRFILFQHGSLRPCKR